MLLGTMHAALPLPKSPLISTYQQQNHLALITCFLLLMRRLVLHDVADGFAVW